MSIRLENVVKSFGTPPTTVLHQMNLEVKEGSFVALTGKSGSGKSTLLYLMSSLDYATKGTVTIDGQNIGAMTSKEVHQFRNQKAGFVFQFHYLLPELTALENVLLPTMKIGRKENYEKDALELLKEFELLDKRNRLPSQLSGGEQQRVAIARALIMKPKYLFADEPTGNLDSVSGDNVMKLLERVHQERGMTVLMVTHDPDYAKRAPIQIHLVDGRLSTA